MSKAIVLRNHGKSNVLKLEDVIFCNTVMPFGIRNDQC